MQELISKLTAAGLSEQQADTAVNIVKDYVKDKFPMFAGAVDKLFEESESKGDFLD